MAKAIASSMVSRMKSRVALFAILPLAWSLGIYSLRGTEHLCSPPTAIVVLERPENNGFLNIVRCTITLSSGEKVELSGGESRSVSIPEGHAWLEVSSFDPYCPESRHPKPWRSGRFKIHLKQREVMRLVIKPKSKGSAYVRGWTIERAPSQ